MTLTDLLHQYVLPAIAGMGIAGCIQDFDDCDTKSCCNEAYDDCKGVCESKKEQSERETCMGVCGIREEDCVKRVSKSSSSSSGGGAYSLSLLQYLPR